MSSTDTIKTRLGKNIPSSGSKVCQYIICPSDFINLETPTTLPPRLPRPA